MYMPCGNGTQIDVPMPWEAFYEMVIEVRPDERRQQRQRQQQGGHRRTAGTGASRQVAPNHKVMPRYCHRQSSISSAVWAAGSGCEIFVWGLHVISGWTLSDTHSAVRT